MSMMSAACANTGPEVPQAQSWFSPTIIVPPIPVQVFTFAAQDRLFLCAPLRHVAHHVLACFDSLLRHC